MSDAEVLVLHFDPSLDALSLRSDVTSSIKMLSLVIARPLTVAVTCLRTLVAPRLRARLRRLLAIPGKAAEKLT